METRRFLFGLTMTVTIVFVAVLGTSTAADDDDSTTKPKDDGYRGIWFTLGQFSDAPYGRGSWKSFWDYGDKYSGGLGTYTEG